MCGIFAYIGNDKISENFQRLVVESNKSMSRGPDNTQHRVVDDNIFLAFHRLRINDASEQGDQPFIHPNDDNIILICNGEIYNHLSLREQNGFMYSSESDCHIILHMYTKYGFKKTIESLDGVFACVLIDLNIDTVYVARDPIGVRPLFFGTDGDGYGFSSDLKSLHNLFDNVTQFKPGRVWDSKTKEYDCYYDANVLYNEPNPITPISDIRKTIRELFIQAVEKRLMSDREIGCLLSGGLDSSLVAALLSRCKKNGEAKLKTFSVGLEGSPDLKYARVVADHLGTDHHEVIVTESTMIKTIPECIQQTETYDITTIRASVPMYILSKYIKENTDVAVIYSGEGSDEASGSYLYFHNAPDVRSFKDETVRLMKDLCFYDVLRCDKSTASTGLEVRVPFLDKTFLSYYMNIDPKYKIPSYGNIEKFLLRSAFAEIEGLLPHEILWRIKEGMSDGVSNHKRGWYEIIQEFTENVYTDETFETLKAKYTWNPPMFKEALYFREIFNRFYPKRERIIPYYWLPKWSGPISDPSARVLEIKPVVFDKKQ
jgi:asparagine synthase (glutamine-hydrolysing)